LKIFIYKVHHHNMLYTCTL